MTKQKKFGNIKFNHPVFKPRIKPTRFYVKAFVVFAMVFMLINSTALTIIAETNYHHNKAVEQTFNNFNNDGFILHQSYANDFQFGLANSHFNGCAWVAIYNACVALNIDISISDIIKELDLFALNAYGLLGSNPFYVKKFFEKRGYSVNVHLNKQNFKPAATKADVSIIGYIWHNILEGGHYQVMLNNEQNPNTFQFYNSTYRKTLEQYMAEKSNSFMFLITISSLHFMF